MAQDPYQQSAGLMQGAGNAYQGVAQGGILQNINDYINPYYEQVLDSAIGRSTDARDQSLNYVGDQAQASSAFGGARHGLTEGAIHGEYAKNIGELTANTQAQAFNSAAGLSQQDIQNQMQAGGAMQGLGQGYFGVGQQLMQNQAGFGQQQQDLNQGILDSGQQQYQNQTNDPYKIMDLLSSLMGQDPRNNSGSGTSSSTPGLFDYLSLGAGVFGAI